MTQAVRHTANGGVTFIDMPDGGDCWVELDLLGTTRLEVNNWKPEGQVHRLHLAITVQEEDATLNLEGMGRTRHYGQEPNVEVGARFLVDLITIDGGETFDVITYTNYEE